MLFYAYFTLILFLSTCTGKPLVKSDGKTNLEEIFEDKDDGQYIVLNHDNFSYKETVSVKQQDNDQAVIVKRQDNDQAVNVKRQGNNQAVRVKRQGDSQATRVKRQGNDQAVNEKRRDNNAVRIKREDSDQAVRVKRQGDNQAVRVKLQGNDQAVRVKRQGNNQAVRVKRQGNNQAVRVKRQDNDEAVRVKRVPEPPVLLPPVKPPAENKRQLNDLIVRRIKQAGAAPAEPPSRKPVGTVEIPEPIKRGWDMGAGAGGARNRGDYGPRNFGDRPRRGNAHRINANVWITTIAGITVTTLI